MSKPNIHKCWNLKHLFTPSKAGIGVFYHDNRFKSQYDVGICTTTKGRCVVSWGLNLRKSELIEDCEFVLTGQVMNSSTKKKRDNYEMILEWINK